MPGEERGQRGGRERERVRGIMGLLHRMTHHRLQSLQGGTAIIQLQGEAVKAYVLRRRKKRRRRRRGRRRRRRGRRRRRRGR